MFRFHKLLHEKINLVFRGKTRRGSVRRHLECFSSDFFLPPVSGGRSSAVALGQLREVTLQVSCRHPQCSRLCRAPASTTEGSSPACLALQPEEMLPPVWDGGVGPKGREASG